MDPHGGEVLEGEALEPDDTPAQGEPGPSAIPALHLSV